MGRAVGLAVLYCAEIIATGALLYIGFHLGAKIVGKTRKKRRQLR